MSANMPEEPALANCWRYSGDNFLAVDDMAGWDSKLRPIGATLQIVDHEMNEKLKAAGWRTVRR